MSSIPFHLFFAPAFQPLRRIQNFITRAARTTNANWWSKPQPTASMTPALQLTAIHLRVSDLARSVEYYVRQLGFTIARQSTTQADLAAGPDSAPALFL